MSASKLPAFERRQNIMRELIEGGYISTNDLAERYCVSPETIRKDLQFLQSEGIAKKAYGGAVVSSELKAQSFLQKSAEHVDAKTRIAERALAEIEEGSVIILDSGSTVAALASAIQSRRSGITVITNSLQAAQILHTAQVQLQFVGGQVTAASGAAIGPWALGGLAQIHADIAFLGTSGFDRLDGPCVENFSESAVKERMLDSATRTVLLADSSKSRQDAMICFAPWSDFDLFITDEGLDPAIRDVLETQVSIETVPLS